MSAQIAIRTVSAVCVVVSPFIIFSAIPSITVFLKNDDSKPVFTKPSLILGDDAKSRSLVVLPKKPSIAEPEVKAGGGSTGRVPGDEDTFYLLRAGFWDIIGMSVFLLISWSIMRRYGKGPNPVLRRNDKANERYEKARRKALANRELESNTRRQIPDRRHQDAGTELDPGRQRRLRKRPLLDILDNSDWVQEEEEEEEESVRCKRDSRSCRESSPVVSRSDDGRLDGDF